MTIVELVKPTETQKATLSTILVLMAMYVSNVGKFGGDYHVEQESV